MYKHIATAPRRTPLKFLQQPPTAITILYRSRQSDQYSPLR